MKNKRYTPDVSVLLLLSTLGVALFSWIASIYGLGSVQNLLSAEGIRWVLGHTIENYVQVPALGIVLMLFMGIGIGNRAGFYEALARCIRTRGMLSRKERRALISALTVIVVYGLCVFGATILPWNFLQSATGTWLHSPFAKGIVYILAIGLGLSGMAYGYVSDAFRGASDVVQAMSSLIARQASYFVALFFVVQFFSSLMYTRLPEWMNLSDGLLSAMYHLCCYLPLLKMLGLQKDK